MLTNATTGRPRDDFVRTQLEEELIEKLQELKYNYRADIRDRAALEANFREKFQELNRVKLTDAEFQRLLDEIVTPDVFTAAHTLRNRNSFTRDDGTPLNYTLVNIKDWCKNTFEVVNQLRINTDNSHHRYDVILLINGVPVVQIELKTLGINPRRAMEQIVEYKNDPGNGYTKHAAVLRAALHRQQPRPTPGTSPTTTPATSASTPTSASCPSTSSPPRTTRRSPTSTASPRRFLAKCTLGQMISRYMVLVASEQKLLMMRPYQIYAVKTIVDCIHQNCGNGYIWHTTGSGKTLTSFKASTLLKDNPDIEKCLFVVDRKDLDRQTREEFNRFQEGCVEENTNTGALVRRLLSDDYADKVIVTTIQKLGLALDENSKRNKQPEKKGKATYKEQLEPLRDKRMVFIFDECHRSQFGDNHQAIKEFFPKAQLFGFTGTPIFEENASYKQIEGEQASLRTTQDLFQKRTARLHHHPRHRGPERPALPRRLLQARRQERAQAGRDARQAGRRRGHPRQARRRHRRAQVQRPSRHRVHQRRHRVLSTCSSRCRTEQQAADPDFVPLNIACVFSPPADGNADVQQIQEDLPQEKDDNEQDPEEKKEALKAIIADYNARFGTNHSIDEFDLYYQDVQKRIKDQQFPNADLPKKGREKIDITIVVDMLLTGFDSKYLNTLYVDKNLKHHGLIQAFSRTNRVLNGTKPYGNILDFRSQQDAVDAAIALFSGEKADKAREIWLVDKAPVVIEKLKAAVAEAGRLHEIAGPRPASPRPCPTSRATMPAPPSSSSSRKCSGSKPSSTSTPTSPTRTRQTIEQILPKENSRLPRRVPRNRPAAQGPAGQGAATSPARTSTSSISSSSSLPPPSSTTTTS